MAELYTPGSLASTTLERFRVFTDEPPDLISTGLGPLDRGIGGMSPGTCGILVAERGLGKSSIALTGAYHSTDKAGILSLEDAPDVTGARLLALKTGISSLDIRLKRLNAEQKRELRRATQELESEDGVAFSFRIAGSLPACLEGLDELAEAGCRMVYVDYVQKVRGNAHKERKDEVAGTYSALQERVAHHNMAALMLSQLTDDCTRPGKKPRLMQARDSKDLVNECRVGLVAWREESDRDTVFVSVEKSTVGGEFLKWRYQRDASGTLREVDEFRSEEEW